MPAFSCRVRCALARFLQPVLLATVVFVGCESASDAGSAGTSAEPRGIAKATTALENAIEIDTCAELQAMKDDLEANYVLTADVDCAGLDAGEEGSFVPIGDGSDPFRGNFDGQEHVIRNLTIDRLDGYTVGLFGATQFGSVRNVGLENVRVRGYFEVGSIAGLAYDTDFTEIYVTGFVSGGRKVGGLIGVVKDGSTIADAYSSVAVEHTSDEDSCGLLFAEQVDAEPTRIYSNGTSSNCTPALVGTMDEGQSITSSFFDCTLAGNCDGAGAEPSSALKRSSHYQDAGWNLSTVWQFDAANTYPCLAWQADCGTTDDSDADETINAFDNCPTDATKVEPGMCGCHVGDACLPTEIDSCAELQAIQFQLDEDYVLTKDIDCTDFDDGDGGGFMPIGDSYSPFTGSLDGNGHVIRNLAINRPYDNFQSLFAHIYEAKVHDLGLEDVEIVGASLTAPVASLSVASEITQVYATGEISGNYSVGGLVGYFVDSTIADSYADVDIESSSACGLIIGTAEDNAHASRSYASGDATECGEGLSTAVDGTSSISASFFDCDVSGDCEADGGESTEDMQTPGLYTTGEWDLEDVWGFADDDTYPCLLWQAGCRSDCLEEDSSCNDLDDDCDGDVDEDYAPIGIGCGVGSCVATGNTECVDGAIVDDCTPGTPGADTTCNGVDEDCDGHADEAYAPSSTSCGVGACAATGTSSCVAGAVRSGCTPGTPAANDTSCNGIDNDCNGTPDEDYVPTGTTCSTGACAATGSLLCVSGSVINTCAPGAPASSDITCNGVDDDCDSAVDDNYQPVASSCQKAGCLATGTIQCVSGSPIDQCPTSGTCIQETDCDDDLDNDEDNATDCADLDCAEVSGCTETNCTNHADDNGNGLVDCADPGCDGAPGCIPEICGNTVDDDGDSLMDCADLDCSQHSSCLTLPPPDISEVAPALNPTAAYQPVEALSFIYEGEDPIQRGVAPGVIEAQRVSLLSGRVLATGGSPLAGVAVDILGREELGVTYTDINGYYHMAVNAGGTLTVRFQLGGFIPAQRAVDTQFQDSAKTEDLILLPRSETVTEIDFSGATSTMQVVLGDVETDDTGTRRAVLMIPAGTEARIYDASGALVPVTDFNLRITEQTVGDQGDLTMPATLPPMTGYTYAVDITGDEALYKHDGVDTWLSNPVIYYLDNFMNVEIGAAAPSGYFDNDAGVWRAIDSGVVLKIVGESGGVAQIDLTGDDVAENSTALAAIGITTPELQQLSTLYDTGKSLQRIPLPHLSNYDHNQGAGPTDETPPPALGDKPDDKTPLDPDCNSPRNSTIDCFSRRLAEDVAVPGTPFSLHYDTSHVDGWETERTIRIPLKVEDFNSHPVLAVHVKITPPSGEPEEKVYIPEDEEVPSEYVWTWNGEDTLHNPMYGRFDVKVETSYSYGCVYNRAARFAQRSGYTLMQPNNNPGSGNGSSTLGRVVPPKPCRVRLRRDGIYQVERRAMNVEGLGGWSFNVHHRLNAGVMHRGDGETVPASGIPRSENVVTWSQAMDKHADFVVGADATVYYISQTGVHWSRTVTNAQGQPVTTQGTVITGGACTQAQSTADRLCRPIGIAMSPTGRLFVVDQSTRPPVEPAVTSMRVLEVNLDKNPVTVTRIAGGLLGFSGEGGPAKEARFNNICDMEAAADGSVYVLSCLHAVVQRISPDGMLERVAGTGVQLNGTQVLGDDATQVALSFASNSNEDEGGIGLDTSGNVYIAQTGFSACNVLQLDRGGRLSIAVPLTSCKSTLSLNFRDVALDPNGGFALAVSGSPYTQRIQRYVVDANGIGTFRPIAGLVTNMGPQLVPLPNIYPAKETMGIYPKVVFGPKGELYFSEFVGSGGGTGRVRKVGTFTLAGGTRELVASSDGSEIYQFDPNGRHLRTRHPLTGTDLLAFGYNSAGLLTSITDEAGNATQIERGSNGRATAIVAPFGQRTELDYDSNGYLSSIETSSNDDPHAFTYDSSGLMLSYVDPRGSTHDYAYDSIGRVTVTEDSEGGSWTFATTSNTNALQETTMTSELGRVTTYRTERKEDGEVTFTVTQPSGAKNTRVVGIDGVATTNLANGAVITNTVKRHPLYEGDAPIIDETILTRGSMVAGANGAIQRSRTRTVSVNAPALTWLPVSALTETVVESDNKTTSHTTTRTYNGNTRTWTITSAEGRVSTAALDTLGRLDTFTSMGSRPLSIDYDTEGRVDTIQQGSRVASYGYHATSGFLETYTNPESEVTTFTTDDVGRVTAIEDANEDVTAFAYDDESNLTGVTPAGRSQHALSYSSVDLYDGYTAPAVGSVPRQTTLTYDDDRALTELEQADGTSLIFGYQTNGLLQTATVPGAGTYTYGYDTGSAGSAQLTSVTTTAGFGSAAIDYGLGGKGMLPLRVTTSGTFTAGSWSAGSLGGSAEYAYSGYFVPVSVQPLGSSQNGFKAAYTWDKDNQLAEIAPSAPSTGATLTFTRSPLDGHLVSTSVNSGMVTTAYDVDVAPFTPGTGDLRGISASANSSEVFATTYQRDALGRIERLDETVLGTTITRKYQYDGAGRLTAVLNASNAVISEYEYDGNGARTRALTPSGEVELGTNLGCGSGLTAAVDAQDRLCRYGDYQYAYDANGRLATKTSITTSAVTEYTYDGLGRLRSVVLPDTTEIDYAHDAFGHRVGKIVDGALVKGWRYGTDPLKPLAELNSSGVIAKTFIYGTRVNVPELIVDHSNNAMYRVITDHLGSVRLVVNVTDGTVIQRMAYDEFGNVLTDTNPGWQPFGFAGGLYDADTALVRFGVRDYDALTGKWIAKDPILFRGDDANLYAYCGSDPANCVDPTGHLGLLGLGVGAAIGGATAGLTTWAGGGSWDQIALATTVGAVAGGLGAGLTGNISIAVGAGYGAAGNAVSGGGLGSIIGGAIGGGFGGFVAGLPGAGVAGMAVGTYVGGIASWGFGAAGDALQKMGRDRSQSPQNLMCGP